METTRQPITDKTRFVTESTGTSHRLSAFRVGKHTYISPACFVNRAPMGYADDTGETTCEDCLNASPNQEPIIEEQPR